MSHSLTNTFPQFFHPRSFCHTRTTLLHTHSHSHTQTQYDCHWCTKYQSGGNRHSPKYQFVFSLSLSLFSLSLLLVPFSSLFPHFCLLYLLPFFPPSSSLLLWLLMHRLVFCKYSSPHELVTCSFMGCFAGFS